MRAQVLGRRGHNVQPWVSTVVHVKCRRQKTAGTSCCWCWCGPGKQVADNFHQLETPKTSHNCLTTMVHTLCFPGREFLLPDFFLGCCNCWNGFSKNNTNSLGAIKLKERGWFLKDMLPFSKSFLKVCVFSSISWTVPWVWIPIQTPSNHISFTWSSSALTNQQRRAKAKLIWSDSKRKVP